MPSEYLFQLFDVPDAEDRRGQGTGVTDVADRRTSYIKRMEKDPWAYDDQVVGEMLKRTFPRMHDKKSLDYSRALDWLGIILRYFKGVDSATGGRLKGPFGEVSGVLLTSSQIGAQMGMTARQVQDMVYRMRRAARGLRTDGRPATGRKRGRPRVERVTNIPKRRGRPCLPR